jgi:hypothetical protein
MNSHSLRGYLYPLLPCPRELKIFGEKARSCLFVLAKVTHDFLHFLTRLYV